MYGKHYGGECVLLNSESTQYSRKIKRARVSKLGWHGNFDTGFERNTGYFVQNPMCRLFKQNLESRNRVNYGIIETN